MHVFNAIIYLNPHDKHSTYKKLQLTPHCTLNVFILEHLLPSPYLDQVATSANILEVVELKLVTAISYAEIITYAAASALPVKGQEAINTQSREHLDTQKTATRYDYS